MSEAAAPGPFDQARASVMVRAAPAEAFRIFTEEIDRWWRRGPRFRRQTGAGALIFIEPGVGGRVFESSGEAGSETVLEIGRTKVWDPPNRLLFSWRVANFQPEEETEVEVVFEATGQGTRVTITHSGWSRIRVDHPARHGAQGRLFVANQGRWWGEILTALREHTLGIR